MSEPNTKNKGGCGCLVAIIFFILSIVIILIFGIYFFRWFAAPIVEETFEAGDTGWLVMGDAQGDSDKPTHESEGGNPGAHMMAVDDAVGGIWYWAAPEEFLQQLTSAWDTRGSLRTKLCFDLKQNIQTNPFEAKDIILSNGETEVHISLAQPPGLEWTSYRVPLDPSAGWLNSATKAPVTEEEMHSVLNQLNKLWIRGEFQTGPDTGGIDNIAIR